MLLNITTQVDPMELCTIIMAYLTIDTTTDGHNIHTNTQINS